MLSMIIDMPFIFSRPKSTFVIHVYSKLKYNEDYFSPILKHSFLHAQCCCFLVTKQTFSYKPQIGYFKGTGFSMSLMETCNSSI